MRMFYPSLSSAPQRNAGRRMSRPGKLSEISQDHEMRSVRCTTREFRNSRHQVAGADVGGGDEALLTQIKQPAAHHPHRPHRRE